MNATRTAVDLEFHTLVAGASGNPVLIDMVGLLVPAMRAGLWTRLKHGLHEQPGRVDLYVEEHRAVLDAIANGGADDARDAMTHTWRACAARCSPRSRPRRSPIR